MIAAEPVLANSPHRPGLRERRGRAVVAMQQILGSARRTVLLPYSIALAVLAPDLRAADAIEAAVAAPTRTPANVARDAHRHPA